MTAKHFGFVFCRARRLTKWQYKHFNAAIYGKPSIQNQKLHTFYCLWVYLKVSWFCLMRYQSYGLKILTDGHGGDNAHCLCHDYGSCIISSRTCIDLEWIKLMFCSSVKARPFKFSWKDIFNFILNECQINMLALCHVIKKTACLGQFWVEKQLFIYHTGGTLFADVLVKITLLWLRKYVQ